MTTLPADLTPAELSALKTIGSLRGPQLIGRPGDAARLALARHLGPLDAEARAVGIDQAAITAIRSSVCRALLETGIPYRDWDAATWLRAARTGGSHFAAIHAVAYGLGCITAAEVLAAGVKSTYFASRIYGGEAVKREQDRIVDYLRSLGYHHRQSLVHSVPAMVSRLLIRAGECRLEAITEDLLTEVRASYQSESLRRAIYKISKALHGLGILAERLRPEPSLVPDGTGINPEWLAIAHRWRATSTLSRRTRADIFGELRRTGRWLALEHPDVRTPADWTRELAAEYVAAVNQWTAGYLSSPNSYVANVGIPLDARTKDSSLSCMRRFFKDCRDWDWFEPPFDPQRAFATPRSIRVLMKRDPRTIADEVWAKLIWAGLNLAEGDLPVPTGGPMSVHLPVYPIQLMKAMAITWLFAGLRVDELVRLRVGCIRWQHPDGGAGAAAQPTEGATCILDVPVHKTGTSFSKPVDPLVGRYISEWEAVRPGHPDLPDPKTGEKVAMLFCFRGRLLPSGYINRSLIPMLCRKAGVPERDARGRITGHRARHTIASQLYNAKEPMSLFELQSWLGHRSPASTQHYVRINPTRLTKAYTDAGYFSRNMRAIRVLVDRDAVLNGTAPSETWQYFDLGHGYCTYNFFEQCQHRMACARCDFYLPKDSTRAQLLEAKANLQRMVLEIPLTDEERAAVEDGQAAVDRLLDRLRDVPTPAGPTPRQLGRRLPVLKESTP